MYFQRWQRLMQRFGFDENRGTFDDLIKAYAEKQRHYHTFEHILACFKHLDKIKHLTEYAHEVELALWFHDAVYQPYQKNNELKSANWVKQFLINNKGNTESCERIFNLIMVTLNHNNCISNDEKFMVDIDLTILGSSTDIYNQFEQNIRKEYRFVPYFLYRKKRKQVLSHFLKQTSIYQNDYFYTLFEQRARYNLSRTIHKYSEY
ncbi:MAG TPA: hypothetical protein ENJ44_06850 [Oceanospirillales bacterium]|nr:hypothetical protein [Oceanospirillales bacterium]